MKSGLTPRGEIKKKGMIKSMEIISTVSAWAKFFEIRRFIYPDICKRLIRLHDQFPRKTADIMEMEVSSAFPDGCTEDEFIEYLNDKFADAFDDFEIRVKSR